MFSDTIRSMTLQTLDKQGQYNYLPNEVKTLTAQALASNDPTTVQQYATQINQDYNAAFGSALPRSSSRRCSAVHEPAHQHRRR